MGKSALVKAIYHYLRTLYPLVLIEIDRKDLRSLPRLQKILRSYPRRVIIFCDDLSFESADTDYKSLKNHSRRRNRKPSVPSPVLRHL